MHRKGYISLQLHWKFWVVFFHSVLWKTVAYVDSTDLTLQSLSSDWVATRYYIRVCVPFWSAGLNISCGCWLKLAELSVTASSYLPTLQTKHFVFVMNFSSDSVHDSLTVFDIWEGYFPFALTVCLISVKNTVLGDHECKWSCDSSKCIHNKRASEEGLWLRYLIHGDTVLAKH